MTDDIDAIMAELAEAERLVKLARQDMILVETKLRRAALKAFISALADRGIVEGSRIVIEGNYSGGWGGKFRDIRHGADPVEFRGARIENIKSTRPRPNCTDQWWWFHVTIARLKKDGKARDEYRNILVKGDTPEAAAAEIKTP